MVGEPKDDDAAPSEEGIAKSITLLAARVGRSIDFDAKLHRYAEEVGEVGTNGKLAAEEETIELMTA